VATQGNGAPANSQAAANNRANAGCERVDIDTNTLDINCFDSTSAMQAQYIIGGDQDAGLNGNINPSTVPEGNFYDGFFDTNTLSILGTSSPFNANDHIYFNCFDSTGAMQTQYLIEGDQAAGLNVNINPSTVPEGNFYEGFYNS
jgi:hypothetical protein